MTCAILGKVKRVNSISKLNKKVKYKALKKYYLISTVRLSMSPSSTSAKKVRQQLTDEKAVTKVIHCHTPVFQDTRSN